MARPQIPLEWMHRNYPAFHELPNTTRSDCSGARPHSQPFYRQFTRRALPGVTRGEPFVTMGTVKRQAIQQGRLLVKHLLPAVWKPVHTLWNEVISFLFLCLAAILGFRLIHALRNGQEFPAILVGFGAAICAWYGIGSYLRARKISRS
jgi:hypothetical protein